MVLKESFIDEREGETMRKIVEMLPIGDKRRLHFLAVVHADVIIGDCPDTTDAIHHDIRCPSDLPCIDVAEVVKQQQPYAGSVSSSDMGSGSLAVMLPTHPSFDPSHSHQNYRIVFTEVVVWRGDDRRRNGLLWYHSWYSKIRFFRVLVLTVAHSPFHM